MTELRMLTCDPEGDFGFIEYVDGDTVIKAAQLFRDQAMIEWGVSYNGDLAADGPVPYKINNDDLMIECEDGEHDIKLWRIDISLEDHDLLPEGYL